MSSTDFLRKGAKSSRGVSLLELMFVLAIMAIVALGGIRQYQRHILKRDILSVKNSVQILTFALNNYYLANCGNLTRQLLILEPNILVPNYLPNLDNISNPLSNLGANAYTLTINTMSQTPETPWKLAVNAHFAGVSDVNFSAYTVRLNPSTSDLASKTMSWEFLPGVDSTSVQSAMKASVDAFSVQQRPGKNQSAPSNTNLSCSAIEYKMRHPT